ncbi:hypothetical protein [Nostoc favosum]|uniref:Uncharacterized protein n=1 Tax=Nostoc favosum CHAB5714 TaxID=2780399 RepID=A0ABS8I986_9NOSO|nr:hypothetical protein [Nostoc favosum]MCC5600645.1 hypothetical protein [Nostoc favosum CHAB5714]
MHPISHRKDCVEEYLQDLYQHFGSQVDYIVVKNHYFSKQFRYYEGSKFQADIKKLNGLELVLGGLHNVTLPITLPQRQAYGLAL